MAGKSSVITSGCGEREESEVLEVDVNGMAERSPRSKAVVSLYATGGGRLPIRKF